MANFFDQFDEPEVGIKTSVPTLPAGTMKVSSAQQAVADKARLEVLENEVKDNPNDPALTKEVAAERKKQGEATPNFFDQFDNAPAPTLRERAQGALKKQPDSFMSRVGTGLADPIYGAAQLADKIPGLPRLRKFLTGSDTNMADVVRQRDSEYSAPEGFDAARMVGNVANPVSWMGGGAGALRAAGQGALQASLAPVNPDADFITEKGKQVALGGAGGAALSKAMGGFKPTAQAQALIDQGIQPSFGQSMGGWTNKVEQQATSLPLVGDAISYARNRASKEFEEAVVERATQGAAKTLDEANAHASRLYDEVVPFLKPTMQSVLNVQQTMRNALQNPELTDDGKKILTGLADKHFKNFGQLDGEGIKTLDSEFGYLARKYSAGDPASKTLAEEIYNVLGAFRIGLEHGLPPDLQGKLQTANRTYAQLIPVNKAASARADERIMPRALQKALARQKHTDVTRMRPDALIDNAVAVLPNTVPDSGTAGRVLLGGSTLAAGLLAPKVLLGGAAAGLGATRPVQRALVGNTAWQKALAPYDASTAAVLSAALRGKRDE
jgi:hypothetical protein